MNTDECLQDKCTYNKMNANFTGDIKNKLIAMCPICPCGAISNIINKDCRKCLSCENIENFIRGRDPMEGMTADQVIKIMQEENVKPQDEPVQKVQLLHITPIIGKHKKILEKRCNITIKFIEEI
jgi:hypothetical protein